MMEPEYSVRADLEALLSETNRFFKSYEKLSSLEICKLMVHSVIQPSASARRDVTERQSNAEGESGHQKITRTCF